MSGTLFRPDFQAAIKDLARRVGILERRTMPTIPDATVLPVRRYADVAINVSDDATFETVEFVRNAMGVTITHAPYGPVVAGHAVVFPQVDAPTFTSGSLTFTAILTVWNPDLSERIRARYNDITIGSGDSWAPTDETVSVSNQIGSDLSIDSSSRVQGSASGIWLAELFVNFFNVPDPI